LARLRAQAALGDYLASENIWRETSAQDAEEARKGLKDMCEGYPEQGAVGFEEWSSHLRQKRFIRANDLQIAIFPIECFMICSSGSLDATRG